MCVKDARLAPYLYPLGATGRRCDVDYPVCSSAAGMIHLLSAGGMRGWLGGGSHKLTLLACSHPASRLCLGGSRALRTSGPSLDAWTSLRELSAPFGPCLPLAQLVGLLVSCWGPCDPFPFFCFSFFILKQIARTAIVLVRSVS
jgi:hypothetical protein